MTTKPLKLKAVDAEDLQVVSAVLQDAIAPVLDMVWKADQKNFVMVVHRLRHEAKDEEGCLTRVRCAVNLTGVEDAKTQSIDLDDAKQILDLLAIIPDTNGVQFIFAGDAKIRLSLATWSMIVEDFGEAWPATCAPCHDSAGAS